VVAQLVGPGCGDQGHEPFDQLTSFHQDVRGAVAPTGLQPEREFSIRSLLQAIFCEGGPRDITTEPFEASAVSRRYRDGRVKAHPTMPRDPRGRVRIGFRLFGVDAIPEASPWLTGVSPGGDARAQ
jgi:hypothetical protein